MGDEQGGYAVTNSIDLEDIDLTAGYPTIKSNSYKFWEDFKKSI